MNIIYHSNEAIDGSHLFINYFIPDNHSSAVNIFSSMCRHRSCHYVVYLHVFKNKKSKIDVRGEGHGKHLMDVILELKTSK